IATLLLLPLALDGVGVRAGLLEHIVVGNGGGLKSWHGNILYDDEPAACARSRSTMVKCVVIRDGQLLPWRMASACHHARQPPSAAVPVEEAESSGLSEAAEFDKGIIA